MRCWLTYCCRSKTNKKKGTPGEIYDGSPRIRCFIRKCQENNWQWGIVSSRYGIWWKDEIKKNYDQDLKELNEDFLYSLFSQLLKFYPSEIIFYKPSPLRGNLYLQGVRKIVEEEFDDDLKILITRSMRQVKLIELGQKKLKWIQ